MGAEQRVLEQTRSGLPEVDGSARFADWQRTAAPDSPWPLLGKHWASIAVAVLSALIVLGGIEISVFRSGLFDSLVRVSSPDSPAAKRVLLGRNSDARVLYLGDSTVLTNVAPRVVSDACECGPGFNAAFSSATPWLIASMTEQALEIARPKVVVLGLSPWALEDTLVFEDSERAREVMSPEDIARRGFEADAGERAQALVGSLWSVYGERALIKEMISSLVPGQRYDESQRGFYVPPGSALSPVQLAAAAIGARQSMSTRPSLDAPGAGQLRAVIRSLKARGIEVVLVDSPLHPSASNALAAYVAQADAVVGQLALETGSLRVDCRSVIDPADFRDFDHLNHSGAAKFSRCLGNEMRTALPQTKRAL